MTALTKYQKLESPGLWREGNKAQRREVIVSLGDTSLVLSDPKQETALAHWSLPAVQRLNPGESLALYSPDPEAGEVLELDDRDMIAALETVNAVLISARPHPGRLRNWILGFSASLVVGVAVFWLPDALIRHTASVLPTPTRLEIGRAVLQDLTRLTGQPCNATRGQLALTRLAEKLFGKDYSTRLIVLREGVKTALLLPGRQIALSETLLAEQDGPDLIAGIALAERIALEQRDPMIPLLDYVGLLPTFQLLTTGVLPQEAVAGYTATLLGQPRAQIAVDVLMPRFEAAGVATTPYANTIDPGGERLRKMVEEDPFGTVAPPPLLSDEDWIGLQDICTN